MSTEPDDPELTAAGVPELTPLGKRIELLRLERRLRSESSPIAPEHPDNSSGA